MSTLILLNKPFRVLSQFTDERPEGKEKRETLAKYIDSKQVYPAGRLDYDSEGLLLLTDDGALQHQIAHPKHKLPKTYWVQVEGEENPHAVDALRVGVELKDGKTKPALVEVINPPTVWDRHPPVRFRQSIPTHWLSITISEGRNRQVRRMTASVGLPTLRLVRVRIGDWELGDLQPGEYQSITIPNLPIDKPYRQKPRKSFVRKSNRNTKPTTKYKPNRKK